MSEAAVVLVAHGSVDTLDELPEFLTNIRRGHAPPPELVAEMRRRYTAIGGVSPLNAINRALAEKLAARLGIRVRLANRLSRPSPKEVLAELAAEGVSRVAAVPLAQHSSAVYGQAMKDAARALGGHFELVCAPNWGRTRELTEAFAAAVAKASEGLPIEDAALVVTAHSLPRSIIEGGDPYEDDLRASAGDLVAALRARGLVFAEERVAFQSQGMSGGEWLGPTLEETLETLASHGRTHIVLAPIGFLADHVEILYDLDVEAKVRSGKLGIMLRRSESLNDGEALVDALAVVAKGLLE